MNSGYQRVQIGGFRSKVGESRKEVYRGLYKPNQEFSLAWLATKMTSESHVTRGHVMRSASIGQPGVRSSHIHPPSLHIRGNKGIQNHEGVGVHLRTNFLLEFVSFNVCNTLKRTPPPLIVVWPLALPLPVFNNRQN